MEDLESIFGTEEIRTSETPIEETTEEEATIIEEPIPETITQEEELNSIFETETKETKEVIKDDEYVQNILFNVFRYKTLDNLDEEDISLVLKELNCTKEELLTKLKGEVREKGKPLEEEKTTKPSYKERVKNYSKDLAKLPLDTFKKDTDKFSSGLTAYRRENRNKRLQARANRQAYGYNATGRIKQNLNFQRPLSRRRRRINSYRETDYRRSNYNYGRSRRNTYRNNNVTNRRRRNTRRRNKRW